MTPKYPVLKLSRFDELIYALQSEDGEVCYVGRTSNPRDRYSCHRYAKSPIGDWLRKTNAVMIPLEVCKWPTASAGVVERRWIQRYHTTGAKLFNAEHVLRPLTLAKLADAVAAA